VTDSIFQLTNDTEPQNFIAVTEVSVKPPGYSVQRWF